VASAVRLAASSGIRRVVVNCWSHWRGTGMALLAAVE
jgi:hypothetical protein